MLTLNGEKTNEAYVSEVDWDKTAYPFAFITPDGEWHEKGEMSGIVIVDKKDRDDWKREFIKAVNRLCAEDDIRVTVADCYFYRKYNGTEDGGCYFPGV